MLELFGLAVAIGFCVLACFAILGILKVAFAILFFPIAAFFWLVGGALKILFLPFQLLGGLILALVLLPLLLIGLPLLIGVGVPLALAAIALVGLWIVGSVFCLVGGLLFGWC
jgi:hypothetical protein